MQNRYLQFSNIFFALNSSFLLLHDNFFIWSNPVLNSQAYVQGRLNRKKHIKSQTIQFIACL